MNIIIIKGYIFDVLKTKNNIYYLSLDKTTQKKLKQMQREMFEDLVLNNRDLYVGTDLKRLKKKISLFIKRYEKNIVIHTTACRINQY